MWVAIRWDDLWIVVICLSNVVIDGSPRKVYRHRAPPKYVRGKDTGRVDERKRVYSTKLIILTFAWGRQLRGAKLTEREGNNPDSRLRSQSHS